MRTGTRTVLAPPLKTSAPATICGRCCLTASRTLSLCRSQSLAPREKRSYQPASPGPASGVSLMAVSQPPSFLREQCRHIAQRFFRTVFVVTILRRQTILHRRNLLTGFIVRTRGRRYESQYITTLLEQV